MRAVSIACICGIFAVSAAGVAAAESAAGAAPLEMLEKAGSEGNVEALLRLGDLYSGDYAVVADLAKAYAYYRRASEAGSDSGKLRVGEMLARGEGVAPDVERGRALVREVADTGNTRALMALGNLYGSGDVRPIDAAAATAAFEEAVAGGDQQALLLLGDLYSDGKAVAVDPSRAFGYYQRAAAAGSDTGKAQVGAMLIRGEGVARDVERGIAMIGEMAASGNASALVSLGDIYARGDAGPIDAAAAIAAYEKAAALGNAKGLLRLGAAYTYGTLVSADGKRAVEYLRAAADAGETAAVYALGKGYAEDRFGGIGSPAEGIRILRELEAAGVPDAVLALADCYLYGFGVTPDPKRAVAALEEAMQAGNLSAAIELIGIYREGRADHGVTIVPRNPSLARSYLAKIEDRLDFSDLVLQKLLLEAASGSSAGFQRIYDGMQALPSRVRSGLLRKVLAVNPNAYVYLVQAQLQTIGLYGSKKTGTLDGPTIRAVNEYCAQKGMKETCRPGPMSRAAAEVVSLAF